MTESLSVIQNRETAYHNRLSRAIATILSQLEAEGINAEEKHLTLLVEAKPPIYSEEALKMLAFNGVRVATTNYSQHVFKLDTEQVDGL